MFGYFNDILVDSSSSWDISASATEYQRTVAGDTTEVLGHGHRNAPGQPNPADCPIYPLPIHSSVLTGLERRSGYFPLWKQACMMLVTYKYHRTFTRELFPSVSRWRNPRVFRLAQWLWKSEIISCIYIFRWQ